MPPQGPRTAQDGLLTSREVTPPSPCHCTMKSEDVFRWFGIDPDDAYFHQLDVVTEEAKREHAEYLEQLSRATITLDARIGRPVVATLVMSPVRASRDDAK